MKNSVLIFGLTSLWLFVFCGKATPQFDGSSALKYLEKQCEFGPRNPGSEGAKKCLAFFESELGKYADKVVLQDFPFYDAKLKKNYILTNVIASFNLNAGQRIFFAAHWDTRPMADMDPDPAQRNNPILGANDGASGVAVLLEMARNLAQQKPGIGVDLILFDGEDYGEEGHLEYYFLGSRHFASMARNYRPKFGILLDMVGDAELSLPYERFSADFLPHIVEKVWVTAESLGEFAFERRPGHYVNDDHKILIESGIPCINVIDFEYPDASHRYWHTHEDTPDKCSAASLESVGRVMMNIIYNESN